MNVSPPALAHLCAPSSDSMKSASPKLPCLRRAGTIWESRLCCRSKRCVVACAWEWAWELGARVCVVVCVCDGGAGSGHGACGGVRWVMGAVARGKVV